MAQFATVLSCVVLLVTVVCGLMKLLKSEQETILAVTGYIVIGLAALFGMIRFLFSDPPVEVVKINRTLSWIGISTGLAFIAAQMFRRLQMEAISRILVGLGVLLLAIKVLSDYRTSMTLSEFVAALAACSILTISLLAPFDPYGSLGAMVLILTGLLMATRGRRLGTPAVGIFHYGLSLALFTFTRALQQEVPSDEETAELPKCRPNFQIGIQYNQSIHEF